MVFAIPAFLFHLPPFDSFFIALFRAGRRKAFTVLVRRQQTNAYGTAADLLSDFEPAPLAQIHRRTQSTKLDRRAYGRAVRYRILCLAPTAGLTRNRISREYKHALD